MKMNDGVGKMRCGERGELGVDRKKSK